MRALVLGLAMVAVAAPAFADTKADALFNKGKKQLAAKKYAEACATFEQVDQLDPAIGAKVNVARCYEEWGKLARAYHWYVDAEQMATSTGDKRAPRIKELVETLDADVPRLTIKLTEGGDPAVARVKLDNEDATGVLGQEQRVDPGPHLIEYEVGTEHKTKTVPLERGASTEVTLEVPKATGKRAAELVAKATPAKPKPVTPPEAHPGRTRRIAGLVTASAGLVGLGISGVLTLGARSSYNDALAAHCMGAKNLCDDTGVELTGDARSKANTATVIAILGAVAVAGGVVLYVTAPKGKHAQEHALYVTPTLQPDGGGVAFGGGF